MTADRMAEASARAEVGIERSATSAENAAPGWIETAAERVRLGVRVMHLEGREDFTIEQVRDRIDGSLAEPPDLRAWGAVTRRATTLGYIERVPGAYRPAASSNRAPKPVYRKGPNS